jgi:methionyl-tRNA synthetase
LQATNPEAGERRSYLTTPIYYVNAAPHVGHAHTSVMGDILKRARQMAGVSVLLSTGVDEHGQKNEASARASGLGTVAYLDERSAAFRSLFDRLDVGYDLFVRTTALAHIACVTQIASALHARELLVKRSYAGLYCQGCEQFKRPADLTADGACIDHPSLAPEPLEEVNYFLPIEPYRAQLLDHLDRRPDWVQPETYANAVRALLAEPLDDLCISRPLTRVSLGVRLPFDPDYVAYVWFDALINYLSNLGWPRPGYERWWAEVEHLVGKDIIKTHAIHWACILLALGEPLPRKISVHAHWLGPGGHKMSKTAGNVVDPLDLVDRYGASTVRLFLARSMRSGDGQVSDELVNQTHVELGNRLGNLVLRLTKFCERSFGGVAPDEPQAPEDAVLVERVLGLVKQAHANLQQLATIAVGVDLLIAATDLLNDHVTRRAPWTLVRTPAGRSEAASVLYAALDGLRLVLEGLYPVMPSLCAQALSNLGLEPPVASFPSLFVEGRLARGTRLQSGEPLFPRLG